jgi:hypothetical protein
VSDHACPDEPHAEITRVGRWTHHIIIRDGWMAVGPDGHAWFALGAKRARRKARRVLASYLKDKRRRATPTTITASDLKETK